MLFSTTYNIQHSSAFVKYILPIFVHISWFAGNRWVYFVGTKEETHGIYMRHCRTAERRQVNII
jgi:hypothetical protein